MVEFVLELNGSEFNIPVRRDGYVNVTKICQAAGKRLQHYKDSPAGKEYIKFLQSRNLAKSDSRIPAITLLTSCKGNSSGIVQGTFAHLWRRSSGQCAKTFSVRVQHHCVDVG